MANEAVTPEKMSASRRTSSATSPLELHPVKSPRRQAPGNYEEPDLPLHFIPTPF